MFLGLDVGQGEHHAVGLAPTGKRLHDATLPNTEPKLRALFDKLAQHGPPLVVVDQPAAIGALPVAVVRAAGHQVAYLPGPAMRRIADLYPGRAKPDARDAFVIADAARTLPHTLRTVDVGDDALAELDVLVGFDDDLASEAEGILDAHPLAGVLISMPGIGVRTAARTPLEIGDASGFASSGHLAAYAGIAPVTRSSGTSIKGEHPARTGNRKLKRAFFLAAFAALHDPTSRAYYDRKRAEGKKHNATLIRLARRRCDVLYAMLRNRTHYLHSAEAVPASVAA
ncbi:transposase IS116/IS110/IS902 family protein [Umezawaea tangerina]|uniref:Transposase IS116/IS110/IS902 family protein n=1 Tax=Umezawaea tangerina TaxID=84725 RepID=A0A2T0TL07_9PSEU|nr:transposase IS116/IS110/IS902 family protein [Umezawaea tangerina]